MFFFFFFTFFLFYEKNFCTTFLFLLCRDIFKNIWNIFNLHIFIKQFSHRSPFSVLGEDWTQWYTDIHFSYKQLSQFCVFDSSGCKNINHIDKYFELLWSLLKLCFFCHLSALRQTQAEQRCLLARWHCASCSCRLEFTGSPLSSIWSF